MLYNNKTESFEPIEDKNAEILILGTFPSKISLNTGEGQYYSNPRNQFWKILSFIYNEEIPETYKNKIIWLMNHKIALWDIIKKANRSGSLDKNIRNEEPNDILNFISLHPNLRLIVINGKSKNKRNNGARFLFENYFDESSFPQDIQILYLPSSSPSCRMTFENKKQIWKQNWITID